MCIGGEVEHHKALPLPTREKQSTGVLCSRARGIYRHLIGPGSWHEPGLKGSLWSRFKPPTGTNGGGLGVRPIGLGSSHQPGPKGPDEPGLMPPWGPAGPWPHEPGPVPPWVPVLDWTGTNGLTRPEPKPSFLLVYIQFWAVGCTVRFLYSWFLLDAHSREFSSSWTFFKIRE
jgi:hypothetical protein